MYVVCSGNVIETDKFPCCQIVAIAVANFLTLPWPVFEGWWRHYCCQSQIMENSGLFEFCYATY